MNKNMDCISKLTEFAPPSPEETQPGMASMFSRFFGFGKSSTPSNEVSTTTPNNEEQSSSEDSKSWRQSEISDKSPSEDTSSIKSFSVDAGEGRSLPNVLKRISNIVATKSTNLQSYKDSELKNYWMPDSVSKQCYECSERFTTFRRRHHCRVCGQIFCSKCCSDEIPGKIMGVTGDLRVCTYCCKVVLSYLQSSDMKSDLSADLKALQEDLEEKYGYHSPPSIKRQSNEIVENETVGNRNPSVGYMEEKYAFGRPSQNYLTSQERTYALQNSASLRMIYEELFRSNQAIILQTHRIRLNRYYNCFLGNELVNWMIAQNKAATRVQATAIGQALFEAGFIEPVLLDNSFNDSASLFKPAKLSRVQSKDFLVENKTSCDAQEPAWVKTIPQNDSTTDSESESKPNEAVARIPSSNSSYYLDLDLESSTVTLKRPKSDDLSNFSRSEEDMFEHKEVNFQTQINNSKVPEDLLNDKLLVQEIKEKEGWHQVVNLKNAFDESSAYNSLTSAYKQHEDSLLRQLLNKEGLSQNWSEVILKITHQIVDQVRPNLYHSGDDMDIRQYVQIKKSVGGSKNDCEIVSGVVCNKNVAHKGMNSMIANPKILLLRCGLMYQRTEGKLLSLEPVMMQESEYLGHTVAKINALGPDIVLVHKSVSRLAQDRLRECGITLVLNVKLSILERLARCTGANIIDTIDAHISTRYMLGSCKKFYLRNFPNDKNGIKTLMYFEECAKPHLGSTILLRGGSQNELRKVKNVVATMIFAAYSCRLEKSFLMDEFARPPSPKDNSFLDESSRNSSPSKAKEFIDNDDKQETKKILEDNTVIQSNDNIENSPIHKSTPIKIKNSDKRQSIDNSENENFDKVNTLLMEASNSYDTLKLFKPKSKYGSDELQSNDKVRTIGAETGLLDSNLRTESSDSISNVFSLDSTVELFQSSDKSKSSVSKDLSKEKPEQQRAHGESVSDKSDPLHQYLNEDDDEDEVFMEQPLSPNGQYLSVADLPLLNKFKKALEGTILSVSPYMKFSIPYLETEVGRNCELRKFFPKEMYYSSYFMDKIEGSKPISASSDGYFFENPSRNINFKPEHPLVQIKLTQGAENREVQTLLSHFRACGSRLDKITDDSTDNQPQLEKKQSEDVIPWPDCLDPSSHQRLSVLFCSFLHNNNTNNAPAFCVSPWVVNMDLYGRNDIALGRFLERYCLTTEYKCPAAGNCKAQVANHVRRFVHDGGCVYINLCEMSHNPFSHLANQNNPNQIFMWSKCSKCRSISPVVPISADTWSLSFAKYLELRFHGSVYTRRGASDKCQHSLHHDHQQYFSRHNMLAVMRYSRISQWEISLPPPLITIIYDSRVNNIVIEEMKSLALKGDEVFSAVKERISGLQADETTINTMKTQLAKDQQYFKNKIEELQLKFTSPTLENKKAQGKNSDKHVKNKMHRIEDGIVIVKRVIAEAVYTWNAKFTEAAEKKKVERQNSSSATRKPPTSIPIVPVENDGTYITEDTASELQQEDLSPISADYNAVEAIIAIQGESIQAETLESDDNEITDTPAPANHEEIVVIQGSPKTILKSTSDTMPISNEEAPDKKKKKKTILSQLLPSAPTVNLIPNPLGSLEHNLLPLGSVVPIIVYESEPSSIIAYALDSHDYKHSLQEQLRVTKGPELNPSPLYRRKLLDAKENTSDLHQSAELKRPSVLSFLRGNSPNPNLLNSPNETDKSIPSSESASLSTSNLDVEDEKKINKQQQNFIEVQFADTTTNFFCRIYFPSQFAALREHVLPYGEDGYCRSLSRSIQWAARGGKSGSTFCKTRDDRFVLKEMNRMDLQIFLDFAPNYFAYMEKCQETKQPTLLGKIVGIYRVSFKNNTSNSALKATFLVMENLFYNRTITDKFDLKGSVRNRLVNLEDVDSDVDLVLLDENLLNMSCDSPLYIRPHAKAVLNKAIEEDTKFLADNCVMDYSLLVGLEPKSDELVIGIIDYLRTFTWDKKLETMVKKSGILGGQGKLPTIVSPGEYRGRFIAAMHKYFLQVPDRWTGLNRGVMTTT